MSLESVDLLFAGRNDAASYNEEEKPNASHEEIDAIDKGVDLDQYQQVNRV
jgi:hypothetical protein